MHETLKIHLILCPIDFSEFSVSAYQHALSVAEHYRAKLVAQHIVELWRHPAADFVASAGLYEEYSQAHRENGKKQLQEFVKKHTHDEIQPELLVQVGVAADSILSFAQSQEADVIVIGTHGRRGFDRLMLGSVTDRVMRTAPCPVIAASKPPHGSVDAGREGPRTPLESDSFLCGFLREFRESFEICDLCDGRVRRRAHPTSRVGRSPKCGQDGRGHGAGGRATG